MKISTIVTAGILMASASAFAQGSISSGGRGACTQIDGAWYTTDGQPCQSAITTSVPFLRIIPDARHGALGDAGLAIGTDASSLHFNNSSLAFLDDKLAIAVTYTPWLRSIGVSDVYLAYLSGAYKIDKTQSVALGIRYFSLGQINLTDESGQARGSSNPIEFEINAAYSRQLSKNLSVGLGLKYIFSRLLTSDGSGTAYQPGTAVAADLSMTYRKPLKIAGNKALLTAATSITNLGTKISYTQNGEKNFIPTNLGIGGALEYNFDEHNSLTLGLDFNKLMVPTPVQKTIIDPVTNVQSNNPDWDKDKNSIADFKEQSITSGMFNSFADASVAEELREVSVSVGLEYWYDKRFAARAGYFYEHPTKGGRQFFSVGLGLKYNIININLSYIVPAGIQRNPLDNTLRFSLGVNFAEVAEEEKSKTPD
jgi:hypothetical protein